MRMYSREQSGTLGVSRWPWVGGTLAPHHVRAYRVHCVRPHDTAGHCWTPLDTLLSSGVSSSVSGTCAAGALPLGHCCARESCQLRPCGAPAARLSRLSAARETARHTDTENHSLLFIHTSTLSLSHMPAADTATSRVIHPNSGASRSSQLQYNAIFSTRSRARAHPKRAPGVHCARPHRADSSSSSSSSMAAACWMSKKGRRTKEE